MSTLIDIRHCFEKLILQMPHVPVVRSSLLLISLVRVLFDHRPHKRGQPIPVMKWLVFLVKLFLLSPFE